MSGTNEWDLVGGLTQDLLTTFIVAEFNDATGSGRIPIQVDIGGTEFTLSAPDVEIITSSETQYQWASCVDISAELSSASATGTVNVQTNLANIFLGVVSQENYLSSDGQSGSYADCGKLEGNLPSTGCSFMAWVNLASDSAQTLLAATDSSGDEVLTLNLAKNQPSIVYDGKTYTYDLESKHPVFTSGQWHHLAVSIHGGSEPLVVFYIDGQPQQSKVMSSFAAISGGLLVGKGNSSYGSFSGKITGVSAWQTALEASSIQQLMNADLTTRGLDTSLKCLGYWQFAEDNMVNLLHTGDAVTPHGGAQGNTEDDPSFNTYAFFGSNDAEQIFSVNNNFANQTLSEQVNSQISAQLADLVAEGAHVLKGGSSTEILLGAGDRGTSFSAKPTLIQLITEAQEKDNSGDWSYPSQLFLLAMMDSSIPPDIDSKSSFADDDSVVIPKGSNMLAGSSDYFFLSLAGESLVKKGWEVSVTTSEPIKLTATKSSFKKHKNFSTTQLQLSVDSSNQGLKFDIQTQFGLLSTSHDVWDMEVSSVVKLSVVVGSDGTTGIKMSLDDEYVSVTANQSNSFVVGFETAVSILTVLFPPIGEILWGLAILWKLILMGVLYYVLESFGTRIRYLQNNSFTLTDIVFADGILVDGNYSPIGAIITDLSTESAKAGAQIQIIGQGFFDATGTSLIASVEIGGLSAEIVDVTGDWMDGTIAATVPEGGTGVPTPVRATLTDGLSSNPFGSFVVLGSKAPSNVKLEETTGLPGDSIKISGTDFTGTKAVKFNGIPSPSIKVASGELTVQVPSAVSAGKVTVTNNVGSATSSNSFSPVGLPVIATALGPDGKNEGLAGQTITITGKNFVTGTQLPVQVLFSNDGGIGTSKTQPVTATGSESNITATIPEGATPGYVWVQTGAGICNSPAAFKVKGSAEPSGLQFTPQAGKFPSTITVKGQYFTGADSVSIGNVPCSFVLARGSKGDSQLTLSVPRTAKSGKISVENSAGTGTSSKSFQIIAAPTLDHVDPDSSTPGQTVAIYGKSFLDSEGTSVVTKVTFGPQEATVNSVQYDSNSGLDVIKASVPDGVWGNPVGISVFTLAGVATGATFSVKSTENPELSVFTPTSGTPGTTVTCSGGGFTGMTSVILGEPTTFTVLSDKKLTFKVPPVDAGSYTITLTNTKGNGSSSTKFTVKSSEAESS